MKQDIKKIVVAYSGGLDTSVIITWLRETYGCEVIAFTADIGQGEELEPLREKAVKTGASRIYIDDLREEFVRDFVFPLLRANAVYEGRYLLGTSIARPLIAKRQIEIAVREGADAVCHGATGKGNDQVRFELTYFALKPDVKIVAPWREWTMKGREELIAYAAKHRIPVTATASKPYSTDRNLLHISYEGGILEDPWRESTDDMYTMAVPVEKAPDKSEYVEVEYEEGDPVALNGKKLSPAVLLAEANRIAGAHGVGRVDLVENRYVGMKSRGVYETPGGTLLHAAHRAVESITMDREAMHLRDSLVAALRRAGLLRVLVRARAYHAPGDGGRIAKERDGHGEDQIIQGKLRHRGPQVRGVSLQPRTRHLRGGRGIQSEGCGRLYPAERAPAEDRKEGNSQITNSQ